MLLLMGTVQRCTRAMVGVDMTFVPMYVDQGIK